MEENLVAQERDFTLAGYRVVRIVQNVKVERLSVLKISRVAQVVLLVLGKKVVVDILVLRQKEFTLVGR